MAFYKRRELVVAIAFVAGILMIADYYIVQADFNALVGSIQKWAVVIYSFSMGLGIINISMLHYGYINRRKEGQWPFSIWMLTIMAIMTIAGVFGTTSNELYMWLFSNIFLRIQAVGWGLLGFYIAAGAYRAFRFKSIDGIILTVPAIILLLKNAPIGNVIWPGFSTIGGELRNVWAVPGGMVFTIGVALGVIALAVRTMFGWESGFYGVGKEAA
jgi:hypothetical protein